MESSFPCCAYFFCRAPLSIRSKYGTMLLTTSWTEGDAVREWRQGVRKLLLLLYTAALLISLGCFLWNASAPVRVHSAPKCYPSKGDEFSLAPVPTLPADSILNTGDAAALDALPGIGPVLSERIITYREECGTFVYPEDLRNIDGIGAALQTKIIDSLDDELTNPPIAPAAETATVPRATLPPDSILNTGDASAGFHSEHRRRCRIGRPAGYRYCAVGADCGIPGGTRRVRVSGGLAERPGHRGEAAASNSRCAGGRKCRGKQLTGMGTVHTNTKLHHQGDDTHVPHPISRRRRCFG